MWRIPFLLFESWGKNLKVIGYTIFPFIRKQKNWREDFLEKRGFIKINNSENKFQVKDFTFFFSGKLPIADVISLLLFDNLFIKKNFLENSAFRLEGPYETDAVFLEEGDTVLDIGANIGLFSIFASRKVGSDGRVFAFEPIEKTREILQKNLKENMAENVEVLPYALAEANKETTFFVNDEVLGDSTREQDVRGRAEIVEQLALDEVILRKGIKKVDFIKADIEGVEHSMLLGAKETIRKFKPKIAICTYHRPDDPQVIENLLKKYVSEYRFHKTRTKLFAWCE